MWSSLGQVVARWTVPVDEPTGAHEVRWFVRLAPGELEQLVTTEFDVLAAGAGSYRSGYALVADLRAEGVSTREASDARLVRLIQLATQYVDRTTGRVFEPKGYTLALLVAQGVMTADLRSTRSSCPSSGRRSSGRPEDHDARSPPDCAFAVAT